MERGPYDVLVESNVMVAMRDGVNLACDIYFPAQDAKRLSGEFPAVLERTPYSKLREDLPPTARFLASHGYVCVIQDCRGRFCSEGVHVSYQNEAKDGYDSIEWIAMQPWCNGSVGTIGLSYGGAVQGATGALNPPSLKSMVPAMAFTYMMSVRKRMGGAARLSTLIREFRMVVDSKEALADPKLREHFLDAQRNIGQWLNALPLKKGHNPFAFSPSSEQDIFDLLQKSEWHPDYQNLNFDVTPHWDTYSDAAVFLIGGWYDSHSLATVESYRNLAARGKQVRMLVGPYKHGSKNLQVSHAGDVDFGTDAPLDYDGVRLEWFDMTLRKNKRMDDAPTIKIFVMGGGSGRKTPEGRLDHGGKWRYEHEWPLSRANITPYYIHHDGALSPELPADSDPTVYQFDPKNPVPTIGGPCSAAEDVIPGGGYDQRNRKDVFGARDELPLAARHDVLVFETEPLEADIEVTGGLEMVLYASSDCVDTDFTVKLIDVYPPNEDYPVGYALNIQDGILRARYRNRREPAEFIEPGQVYEFRIVLFPTSNVFKKGHKIRLDRSSSNFPRFDVNPNTGEPLMANRLWKVATNSIYHDPKRPSRILLPIVE